MGYIYLYIGTGAGKTTNALGLALRSLGHNHKVIIIQFMKAHKDTGEVKIAKKLRPYYSITPVGRKGWINFKAPSQEDKAAVAKGMALAYKALKAKPNLLVLDELALAAWGKLVPTKEVIKLLKAVPKKTNVVITGRYAPRALISSADFVNEIKEVRYPKKMIAVKGINW
jgi:cob(I)alamin adenosyltransferase